MIFVIIQEQTVVLTTKEWTAILNIRRQWKGGCYGIITGRKEENL